ncbi:DEAD/DEAH box helicase [Streptomyces longwoodensis]|uniref:DEAD/DEAH box helicase n=1 Tax=Streptomyces longwoodensis TaxID=68231 RepID=UPI0033FF4309
MSEIWIRSPREWQQAAFEDFTSRLPHTYPAAVCPGGGKTEYALAVAKYLIQQGQINFVIVVSPTDALTRQWADKGAQFGIALNPEMSSRPLNQSREFVGGSVTYGLLAGKKETAAAFSKAMQIRRTMVILDEAHHTGENKAWGIAVQTAFELTRHRLLLTGTPRVRTRTASPSPATGRTLTGCAGSCATTTTAPAATSETRSSAAWTSASTTQQPTSCPSVTRSR